MTAPAPDRGRAALRGLTAWVQRLRGPLILLAVYLILRAIFGAMTQRGGLVTPSGDVSPGVALLGVTVLALRLAVLFVLPGVVVYRLAARVLERPRG